MIGAARASRSSPYVPSPPRGRFFGRRRVGASPAKYRRLKRVREYVPGLFGKASAWRWGVQRSSNAYSFNDPASSKSDFQTQTSAQELSERKVAGVVPPARTVTSRAGSSVEQTRSVFRAGHLF
jgi:hypothetical protein